MRFFYSSKEEKLDERVVWSDRSTIFTLESSYSVKDLLRNCMLFQIDGGPS